MLSTKGLKMSRNSYKDNVSSIIKNSHQTRTFYCALYLLILGRGEESAFSFASLCASSDAAVEALVTACSCGCDDIWGFLELDLTLLLAKGLSLALLPLLPWEKQLKCPSAASASLKTFLCSPEQQGKEIPWLFSGLDNICFIKYFCIFQIFSSWSGADCEGTAWSLNTFQAGCYYMPTFCVLLDAQWGMW